MWTDDSYFETVDILKHVRPNCRGFTKLDAKINSVMSTPTTTVQAIGENTKDQLRNFRSFDVINSDNMCTLIPDR